MPSIDETPVTRVRELLMGFGGVGLLLWRGVPGPAGGSWHGVVAVLLSAGFVAGTVTQGATLCTERGRRFVRWQREHRLATALAGLLSAPLLVGGLLLASVPMPYFVTFGVGFMAALPVVGAAELAWFRWRADGG